MTPNTTRARIPPGLSMFLDLSRIALSLVVALGHATEPRFQDLWGDLTQYAVACVGGFFVISGYTIRLLYPGAEDFSLRRYWIERWSRILSVTIPALLLTAVLDTASQHADPEYYRANWAGYMDHPLPRLLINLFGLAQVWGQDISPLSNSPFWSLSYELSFYLVYGLWLSGRRRLAIVCLILLGPHIAAMLPLWLLGVVAHDLFQPGRGSARRVAWIVGGLAAAGVVAAFGVSAREHIQGAGINLQRVQVTLVFGTLVFFALFVPTVALTRRLRVNAPRLQHVIRRLGDMTFPLYLFHFPILVFMASFHLYDRQSAPQQLLAFGVLLLIVALATPATDALKIQIRARLLLMGTRRSSTPPTDKLVPKTCPHQ